MEAHEARRPTAFGSQAAERSAGEADPAVADAQRGDEVLRAKVRRFRPHPTPMGLQAPNGIQSIITTKLGRFSVAYTRPSRLLLRGLVPADSRPRWFHYIALIFLIPALIVLPLVVLYAFTVKVPQIGVGLTVLGILLVAILLAVLLRNSIKKTVPRAAPPAPSARQQSKPTQGPAQTSSRPPTLTQVSRPATAKPSGPSSPARQPNGPGRPPPPK